MEKVPQAGIARGQIERVAEGALGGRENAARVSGVTEPGVGDRVAGPAAQRRRVAAARAVEPANLFGRDHRRQPGVGAGGSPTASAQLPARPQVRSNTAKRRATRRSVPERRMNSPASRS